MAFMTELDRDLSLCGHAINDPSNVMVTKPDTRNDVRFSTGSYWEANVVLRGCATVNDKGFR
jgi:hypothetical protein